MPDVEFDPRQHPRNRVGRFTQMIAGLEHGSTISLPGGWRVQKNPEWGKGPAVRKTIHGYESQAEFHYGNPGRPLVPAHNISAHGVASIVLNNSAKSRLPDSLGGTHSYTTLNHFEQRERKVAKLTSNARRARSGEDPRRYSVSTVRADGVERDYSQHPFLDDALKVRDQLWKQHGGPGRSFYSRVTDNHDPERGALDWDMDDSEDRMRKVSIENKLPPK